MIDTSFPQIAFVTPSVNNSVTENNYIAIEVDVDESTPKNITYVIANDSVWNSTTYTMTADTDNVTINFTSLAEGVYQINATVFDLTDLSNTTELRYVTITNLRFFFNGFEGNNSAELGGDYSLLLNSSQNMTICVDIVHPDFGTNYSCLENNTLSFDFSLDYFRNTTFTDGLTYNMTNYSSFSSQNLTIDSHQYDEIDSLTFNISGVSNPYDTVIFKANTTPDMSNQTQFEPLIDRFYDGYLNGSNVYVWEFFDNVNETNLTYASGGEQFVYFLLDDILSTRTTYSFLINITGYLFGTSLKDGNSTTGSEGFDNFSNIDKTQTDSQLDLSGVIMPKNVTENWLFYDDFEDGILNQTLWVNGSCSTGGVAKTCVNETGGNLMVFTSGDTGSASNAVASLDLSRFESDEFNFSFLDNNSAFDKPGVSSGIVNTTIWFGNALVWNFTEHDAQAPIGFPFTETGGAILNFSLNKVNKTYWKANIWGSETSNNGTTDFTIQYTGDETLIPVNSNTLYLYVSSASGEGIYNNIAQIEYVNESLWDRQNGTVVSNSVYDSSSDIDQVDFWVFGKSGGPPQNISFYLSNDDGVNWGLAGYYGGAAGSGQFFTGTAVFSSSGKNLRWRVHFNSTDWNFNNTMQLWQVNISVPQGNVSDLTFDWGDDGTVDSTVLGNVSEINGTITVTLSDVNISTAFNSSNQFTNLGDPLPHTYKIPLSITSQTRGILELKEINLTYNPNPVSLNTTYIQNKIGNSTNFTNFTIPIATSNSTDSIEAQLNITDLKRDYAGGNQSILFKIHDSLSTLIKTFNITYYYSRWDFSFIPDAVDFLFFGPQTPTSLNVTPHGQSDSAPILNVTNLGYNSINSTLSVYLNGTISCVNTTLSQTINKIEGFQINESWINITSLPYLGYTNISLWADYNCSYTNWTIYNPQLFFRQCIDGGECATSLV